MQIFLFMSQYIVFVIIPQYIDKYTEPKFRNNFWTKSRKYEQEYITINGGLINKS